MEECILKNSTFIFVALNLRNGRREGLRGGGPKEINDIDMKGLVEGFGERFRRGAEGAKGT